MVVAISGEAGSGKSTMARKLAEALGWPRFYVGGIRRKIAAERKMTLEEFNKLGETDPSTDREPDNYVRRLGETRDDFIIEGRMAWHFIPRSFKIFLTVDEKVGAERVWLELQNPNARNEAVGLQSVKDVLRSHATRRASDIKRYKKYYNIDAYDHSNYDFVLDTTHMSPEQIFEKVLGEVEKRRRAA